MATSRKLASIERRNQIIDAALTVFSTKGFGQATNKDIATAAGINSPGLIYHYFEDQEALFKAVLQERAPVIQWTVDETDADLSLPPKQMLTLIAQKLIETMSDPQSKALMKIFFTEAIRQPQMVQLFWEGGSVHLLGFVYRYFEQLMEQGDMRQIDLGVAVRSFLGPFFLYMVTSHLVDAPDPNTPEAATLVETAVDIFWKGVT